MKIGIIGAMEEEVVTLKAALTNPTETTIAGADFIEGTYGSHEIVLVRSGIGKVNAAITTTVLADHYQVDQIINTGSAGGIGKGLHIGDIVISQRLAYHDADVTAFGYEKGQMAGMPRYYEADEQLIEAIQQAAKESHLETKVGLIVSGDQFIHSDVEIQRIHEWFPEVLASEMEGAAIAQVAYQFNIPFVVIRAMSDTGDSEASVNFDDFIIEAGKKSAEMVLHFLDHQDK